MTFRNGLVSPDASILIRPCVSIKCKSHSNRQPSLNTLTASTLLFVVISVVSALLMAVMPAPSCCWADSTFLSRDLTISLAVAETSMLSFGACSSVQLLGTKYCFKILSFASLDIPFLSKGCHNWHKVWCISSPNVGPTSVASPRACKISGSTSVVEVVGSAPVGWSATAGSVAGGGSVADAVGSMIKSTASSEGGSAEPALKSSRRSGGGSMVSMIASWSRSSTRVSLPEGEERVNQI
ncbi:hypothetical protein JYU34_006274 [Plutella xylostella]|uniref:Uncharacterized protein n=1 Tax=Plutella xylostella TaxID=51655 RepID=A0ABQ7QRQ3_PLUXY|nr:hypothetical protein JYU34_006274 [Plutella xylostella]